MPEGYDEPISDATRARARREGWSGLIDDPVEPAIRTFHKRPAEVQAFNYNGTFPLAFLRLGEFVGRVRNAPEGRVAIDAGSYAVDLDIGDWLVREGKDLKRYTAGDFSQAYEASA